MLRPSGFTWNGYIMAAEIGLVFGVALAGVLWRVGLRW